jgi:hypothetical protein
MPLRQSATWTDLQFSVMTPKQCHAKENAESNAYAWDPYPSPYEHPQLWGPSAWLRDAERLQAP